MIYKVTENPYYILRKCRIHSKGTFVKFAIGICFLYVFMNWIPNILAHFYDLTYADFLKDYLKVENPMLESLPSVPLIVYLYGLIFYGVFSLAEALYVLTYLRAGTVEYVAMFESLKLFIKSLLLFIVKVILISVGIMFFIIPGIIVAIDLSQCFYILADNPKKSVADILKESRSIMIGNRLHFVSVLISCAPYYILGYVPAFLIEELLQDVLNNNLFLIISFLSDIPLFFAIAFIKLNLCTYYEILNCKGMSNFKYLGEKVFRERISPM